MYIYIDTVKASHLLLDIQLHVCSYHSPQIGLLGLLERENAAIMNEALKPLAQRTVRAFRTALDDLGLKCAFYLTQNDGTLIRYVPILCPELNSSLTAVS